MSKFKTGEVCWAWIPVHSNKQAYDMDLRDVVINWIEKEQAEVETITIDGWRTGNKYTVNAESELVKADYTGAADKPIILQSKEKHKERERSLNERVEFLKKGIDA